MFSHTSRKLSRAAIVELTFNSRTALLALAAIATMTAAVSPAAADKYTADAKAVLEACDRTPSCSLHIDNNGNINGSSDHSVFTCAPNTSTCTGNTFIPKNPNSGTTKPTRPVVNGVSAGGNPGTIDAGGTLRPIQTPISVKPPVTITKPLTTNPASPPRINLARANHK
jgi:hypothetical protein